MTMALEYQIRQADRPAKPAPIPDLQGRDRALCAGSDDPIPEHERAGAEWMLRRLANRHGCPGRVSECGDPEAHRRDLAAAHELIDALNVAPPPLTEPARPPEPATKRRTGPPRHGTLAAYQRHLLNRETPCATCHSRVGYDPDGPGPEPRAYDVAELASMPESTLTAVLDAGQHPAERTDSDAA
jgi:hypothetical protein